MNDQNTAVKTQDGMSARASGALLLAAGLVVGYMGIVSPILAIRNQAAEVEYYSIAFFLTPFALLAGLIYVVLGDTGKRILGDAQSPKKPGIALGIGCVLVGIGLMFWFKGYLQAAGYGG